MDATTMFPRRDNDAPIIARSTGVYNGFPIMVHRVNPTLNFRNGVRASLSRSGRDQTF